MGMMEICCIETIITHTDIHNSAANRQQHSYSVMRIIQDPLPIHLFLCFSRGTTITTGQQVVDGVCVCRGNGACKHTVNMCQPKVLLWNDSFLAFDCHLSPLQQKCQESSAATPLGLRYQATVNEKDSSWCVFFFFHAFFVL